jgi:hypothetical protein
MALTMLICSAFTDGEAMAGLMAVFLPLYGFLNGYISSVYFRFFKGSAWVQLSLYSALSYPMFLTLVYTAILFWD